MYKFYDPYTGLTYLKPEGESEREACRKYNDKLFEEWDKKDQKRFEKRIRKWKREVNNG